MMKATNVGVVGAGIMGTGVAQCFASAGIPIILIDISSDLIDRAREEIRKNLRFQLFFSDKEEELKVDDIMDNIYFSTNYNILEGADFIIENVTEQWDIKKQVFEKLDTICPDHCIFASNTSAIPITKIASVTKRQDKIIGTHFMNPVTMKDTVEVVRGDHTSAETIDETVKLLAQLGKKSIIVGDSPGFVSNRVLMLTVNEAICLLHEGVAPAKDIDSIFKSCFGHKMGPLETADLIGLDTILYSLEVLVENFNDGKFTPSPLLKKMVSAGLHGRKSGEGFYRYAPDKDNAHSPGGE